jgi:predicted methyltransferase
LRKLQNSINLNDFICNSCADFDNLAHIVDISIDSGFIKLDKCANITSCFNFQYTVSYSNSVKKRTELIPKSSLNQFPCDEESRCRRYDFIKERYPYVEYLKFAIIGDDDFLSLKFINDYWAWPVVIETDDRIVKLLKSASDRIEVYNLDVTDVTSLKKNLSEVQTFITDPPYTLNGALVFIFCGLNMLVKNNDVKEFYVILNSNMMGKNLFRLQKILINADILLIDIINNFSQYDLPANYAERRRTEIFSNKHGVDKGILKKSSSSNMYIFSTIKPDLKKIKRILNFNNIYNHYDH